MCVCIVKSPNRTDVFKKTYPIFLQWHVTSKCDQKCRHCYMFDSPFYLSEAKNELSLQSCKSIIDDFVETKTRLNTMGNIVFSGGDPLLRRDIFEIINYARVKNVDMIGMMGNSYHLNEESSLKLKESGVFAYQISLDGMEKTHDYFRRPGSFNDAIRGFKVLKDAGISATCMFTLSKVNMNELINVIRLCADLGIDAFDFDRLVPVGSASEMKESMIEPEEYKSFLIKIKEEYDRLRALGYKTSFGYKDNLWSLVFDEREMFEHNLIPSGYMLERGCIIGKGGLAVLADGNVLACRRLPLLVGKLPEQKIYDVLFKSESLKKLKDFSKVEKCCSCENLKDCGGCRAIAYAHSGGNYYAPDPQCWC